MKGKVFVSMIAAMFSLSTIAQVKGQTYVVDKNGDIMITKIIEGLAMNKHEILSAAQKYMEEAYRDTKYKIVINS